MGLWRQHWFGPLIKFLRQHGNTAALQNAASGGRQHGNTAARPYNLLSVDVEDYFQVQAFASVVKYADWEKYESRIERNTDRLLEILNGSFAFNCNTAALQHRNTPPLAAAALQHRNTPPLAAAAQQHGNPPPLAAGSTATLQHGNTGTFFILGWIAERYPNLVRRIKGEGHEIACHGYAHRLIYTQTLEDFRQDIQKAKAILEDITGEEVIGYRAPSYSITKKSLWALRILAEEGFKYDSSIFPIRHDLYGIPDAPRFPFLINFDDTGSPLFSPLPLLQHRTTAALQHPALGGGNTAEPQHAPLGLPQHRNTATRHHAPLGLPQHGNTATRQHFLYEFPLSTVRFLNMNLPISGGGYFRLLPYSFFKRGLNRIISKERQPFIFYIHPWEIDFDQPKIGGVSLKSKFRHRINLKNTEGKLKKLLSDFPFSTINNYFHQTNNIF